MNKRIFGASIAQLVERRAYTSVVPGSSPGARTKNFFSYTSVVPGSSPGARTIYKKLRYILPKFFILLRNQDSNRRLPVYSRA